jgi:hypothetical protein
MDTSQTRKRSSVSTLLDPKIVWPAIRSSFVKLDPRSLMKNPVMFVLEIVTLLTTVILIRDIIAGSDPVRELCRSDRRRPRQGAGGNAAQDPHRDQGEAAG